MTNPLIKFVESVCVQTAVYWGNPRPDGLGGTIYDEPVEIPCRWDSKVETVTDSNGQETVSRAQVLVTQDLSVDGRLMLATLNDLDPGLTDSPESIPTAYRIIQFAKNPLFRSATEFVRQVYL